MKTTFTYTITPADAGKKISQYLSEQGYDLNKAGEEWQLRIKERNSN